MDQQEEHDRYVSFCGIDCDRRADALIERLRSRLDEQPEGSLWRKYFEQKFEQQAKLDHDNLFYVGAQLNTLYSFFDEIGDKIAREMLWKLELECC